MSHWKPWISLEGFARFEDQALLFCRLGTGVFLVHGVIDNIVDVRRMREFTDFVEVAGIAPANFWAPFSVYTQFLAGILAILGLWTRWAGAIIAITFVVALGFVHWNQSLREWWPALSLALIGLIFLTHGAGKISLDRFLQRRQAQSDNH